MGPPRASIIIPAHHSDDTIAGCLQSLRDQTFRDFDVIVVNSSSEERTRRVVERFPDVEFEQSPVRLLPHAARNHGVQRARGELLVFTDPDCRARPDWLEQLVRAVNEGHDLVCGAIELTTDAGWFARGVHLCKYSFRLSSLPGGPCAVAGTATAACTREVWNAAGPFDGERFAGDGLLSWRAAAKGWQPWFEPRAVVEHGYTGTLGSLWRERVERGEDFGLARMAFERWSRIRAALYLVALPVLMLVVLGRTASDALRGGWGRSYLSTLPVQFVGHLAWLIGEMRAYRRRGAGRRAAMIT